METYLGFPQQPLDRPAFLTIGNFDGVHRGHQALVSQMAAAAHQTDSPAGLLTFDPHPLAVLHPTTPRSYLTTLEERADLLEALGLDFVLMLPFDREVAAMSAADFMGELTRHLTLRELWIGPDFALGRGREGHATRLAEIGQTLGYRVRTLLPFDWRGETVRSSRVRALLAADGAVDQAADLLGRAYRVSGQVQSGAQRGRTLGFPTANLAVPADKLVPAHGVYACWAWREDEGHPAIVNIGVRPTFDNGFRSVEAYLLDFAGDLYGQMVALSFIHKLRGEQRFANRDALIGQIDRDVEATRRILADPPDHAALTVPPFPAWEELVHTADWAIRVHGDTQRQAFARAAAAMYLLQDADLAQPITLARSFSVNAERPSDLLVVWLNRLLLGQELGGELYTRFEINEISPVGLRGVACGYRGTPTHTAIKAVTYYDLSVEETAEGWTARVTFDV